MVKRKNIQVLCGGKLNEKIIINYFNNLLNVDSLPTWVV